MVSEKPFVYQINEEAWLNFRGSRSRGDSLYPIKVISQHRDPRGRNRYRCMVLSDIPAHTEHLPVPYRQRVQPYKKGSILRVLEEVLLRENSETLNQLQSI